MILVFKIKFKDTLRRWSVSEDVNAKTLSLSFSQLEDKIRDLFLLSQRASLVLTYIDEDNDVVTLGDDQDLVDACLIQQINPLRLEVHEGPYLQDSSIESSMKFLEDGRTEKVSMKFIEDSSTEKVSYSCTSTAEQLNVVKAISQDTDLPSYVSGSYNEGLQSVLSHVPIHPNHGKADKVHQDVVHHGIRCDGCGMNPIQGPRYRSKKHSDYDLCFTCFDVMGMDADFEKLEHPETGPTCSLGLFPYFKRGSRSLASSSSSSYMPGCPFSGQAMEFFPSVEHNKELDARFVEDVTVLDGTELDPGTRFTKTWRMENSGTRPWPKGTQLVHVGGTTLSSMEAVKLELPEGGLLCGQRVEISIDLEAPNVVGSCVSHWRLVSPSGQCFGHTIWVAIQVQSQAEISNSKASHFEKMQDTCTFGTPQTNSRSHVLFSEMAQKSDDDRSMFLPKEVRESLVLDIKADHEVDGFSAVEKTAQSDQAVTMEKVIAETDLDTQVNLLESMGFGDRESNLSCLKKNKQNLQKTLTDLVICAGWEEKLRNIEGLGFKDQGTNIRLLHKHEGSIKLVVKELVKIENQTKKKQARSAIMTA